MTTWESGRESKLFDAILDGRKTIEGRLNKGKFAQYKEGDIVLLRRDVRDENGVLHDGQPNAARVKIVGIRSYPDFLTMVTKEGFQKVIPDANAPQEAADEYNTYYSSEDQARYGVLAIEVRPLDVLNGPVRRRLWGIAFVGIGILLFALIGTGVYTELRQIPRQLKAVSAGDTSRPFPATDMSGLTQYQQKVLHILRQEYEAQPTGTKYTEGADEPWCADFVSWVMNESGIPLLDPDTKVWRHEDIPPLQAFFESAGRFKAAGTGYVPKVGDVIMYETPSPFGDHANIVINNQNGRVTTVGGNEGNEIRIQQYSLADDAHIIGYGTLQ